MPPLVVQLSKLRRELNGRLKDFIGDYEHIDNTLEVHDPEDKSKALQYVFNDKNNIFVDIEAVERSMIKLYGITLDGKYSCHNLHE
jgi:DNA phosphorothioation-dependent restriction protein DptG